jgi:hypothetical protein
VTGLAKKTPWMLRKSTHKRVKLWLRRDHWFGVPRWVVLAIAMGLIVIWQVYGVDRESSEEPPAKVAEIVDGLRTTSVYAEKGNPGKVDVGYVRELVGDRPIVVVVLDTTPMPVTDPDDYFPNAGQDMCQFVADEVATSIVILYGQDPEDGYGSSFCIGPDFSNPQNPVDADEFDFPLTGAAEVAWQYRVTDDNLTPEVEEYVYAFDAKAAEVYPNGTPRRAVLPPAPPAPDTVQTGQLVLSFGGILAGTVLVFLLLRLGGRALLRRGSLVASSEHRRSAAGARLNRLADRVLHPEPATDAKAARDQAELAKRYVLLLADYDQADTKPELDHVERELTALELGVPTEEEEQP